MGRKHGWNLPLDPHQARPRRRVAHIAFRFTNVTYPFYSQVGALIFFCFLAAGVYAFYVPCVEDRAVQISLVVVYSVLVVGIISLNLATSLSDPSDPGVYDNTLSGTFYCALCQAGVGANSKHCRSCDRCVEGFDHHCKWLNNCIGERNYRSFFLLVLSTVTILLFQFGWGVWLVSRSFFASDEMELIVADAYGSMNYNGWQAALFIYLAFLVAAILMLGELLSFHLVLVMRGMTTYEFIMASKDTQSSAQSMSVGSGGARAALFRSSKVADEGAAKRKGAKVSLNPCKAICAHKMEGEMQTWGQRNAAGRAGAAGGAANGVAGESLGNMRQCPPQGESGLPVDKSVELGSYTPGSMPISENYAGGLRMGYNAHVQTYGYQQARSMSPAHGYQQAQSLSPASGYQQPQYGSPAHMYSPACAHNHMSGYSPALGARSARLLQHAGPINGEISPAYIPPMMASPSQPRASPQGLQPPSPSMQTPYSTPPIGVRGITYSPYSPYPVSSSPPAASPGLFQSPTLPPQSPGRPGGFSTPPSQGPRVGASYDGSGYSRVSNQGLPSLHAASPPGRGLVTRNSGQTGGRHMGGRSSGSPTGSVRGSYDGQPQSQDAPRGSWRSGSATIRPISHSELNQVMNR
eukprot:gene2794-12669_t